MEEKKIFNWKSQMEFNELLMELRHITLNGGENKRIKRIQLRLEELKGEGYGN